MYSLGIHWGTFDMYTTEPVYEPPHRVNAEMVDTYFNLFHAHLSLSHR